MIRDMVLSLSNGAGGEAALNYSIALAKELESYIEGIAFTFEPVIPATVVGDVPPDIIEQQREDNERMAKAALTRFEQAATAAGLKAHTQSINASFGGASVVFGEIARRFDLSVAGQPSKDEAEGEELVIEGALLESGRPVLVIPAKHTAPPSFERIVLCWDGSRAAARAVADSLPLLQRSKLVDILVVQREKAKAEITPGIRLNAHLQRHGLQVEVKRTSAVGNDIPGAILAYAAESKANMLVMGGYGHSRLREFLFGGATRGMLAAMTVPTLMSH